MTESTVVFKTDRLSVTLGRGEQRKKIIGELTLNLYRHEYLMLVGPSGCGKSTVARIVVDQLLGRDLSEDLEVVGEIEAEVQSVVGYLPQSIELLGWRTANTNVELAEALSNSRAADDSDSTAELLSLVELAEAGNLYPHEMSIGMQQRVALARALRHQPSVLCLDEPYSHVDWLLRRKLRRKVREIAKAKETTVLHITHDVDEAVEVGDRVLVLSSRPMTVVECFDIPRVSVLSDEERELDSGVRKEIARSIVTSLRTGRSTP